MLEHLRTKTVIPNTPLRSISRKVSQRGGGGQSGSHSNCWIAGRGGWYRTHSAGARMYCSCHNVRGEQKLDVQPFELIVITLHFDDSRMFELIRAVKKHELNASRPIICYCSRATPISRLMHESLESTTKLLGAWMYLDEHSYNVFQDPDAELRRIMERCLTDESRKEIQQQRLDIQKQRHDRQQIRLLLQGQEWSPELSSYLDGLKYELEALLKEITRLEAAAEVQRTSVETSRDLKDRVAEHVRENENGMTSIEKTQSAEEIRQSMAEEEQAIKEAAREAEALRNRQGT